MTMRLVFGLDPGTHGALGWLADGQVEGVEDMPRMRCGRVDGYRLRQILREVMQRHAGADVLVVLELVSGFRGQGGASQFTFGQADGIARGVVMALDLPWTEVRPQVWKARFRLLNTGGRLGSTQREAKGASRRRAAACWPELASLFSRVKDDGRAEALLLARWGWETEAWLDARGGGR